MRWIVLTALVIGPSVALAPALEAQGAAPAAATAANPKLAGAWEGTFTSDGPSGPMSLEFSSGTPWKVAISMGADAGAPGEATGLVIDGNKATWRQAVGEYDVVFVATLNPDGTQVAGTLEASQGGTYVGGGSFTLSRKAK